MYMYMYFETIGPCACTCTCMLTYSVHFACTVHVCPCVFCAVLICDSPIKQISNFDNSCPEPESRIKNIKIKEKTEQPQATVDELKASVMSLRLGTTSPGIKKATSTHSLDGTSSCMYFYGQCVHSSPLFL